MLKVSGKFDLEQERSHQGVVKVVISTINTTKLQVRLQSHLKIRFIQKPIIIITKWMRQWQKYRYRIFR
jgi:hypothetical protein